MNGCSYDVYLFIYLQHPRPSKPVHSRVAHLGCADPVQYLPTERSRAACIKVFVSLTSMRGKAGLAYWTAPLSPFHISTVSKIAHIVLHLYIISKYSVILGFL